MNAVAADGTRFSDLKERFTFVGGINSDPIEREDWKGRGITPIPYDSQDDHSILNETLQRWAMLSAINGNQRHVDATIKRIVRTRRSITNDADRDLFDHLFRRGNSSERVRLSALASIHKADLEWLDALVAITAEGSRY